MPGEAPNKRTDELGSAPVGGLLIRLSIPGMVGMLVMSLYNVIDTFWVSGLPDGGAAIAALTVMFPVQLIAGALGMATGVGVASLVSRRFGEGRLREANDVGGNAVALPLLSGAVLAVVALAVPQPLLRLLGARSDILRLSHAYLTTVVLGLPFVLFAMSANGLYRGAGNTLTPMVVMSSSAGINALLDPFLIYGWGPFPRLEVRGAALATVIAQVCAFTICAAYLWSGRSGYRIRVGNLALRWRIFRDIAQVGTPAFVMYFAHSIVVSVFNRVLGGFGSVAIAAYGLSFRIMMVIFPWMAGVNQGLLPIVGYNFGAKQYRRVWQAVFTAAAWTSGLGLAFAVCVWAIAPRLVGVFAKDAELARLAALALRIHVVTLLLVAPQIMSVVTLQGMGMGWQAMVLTLARELLFVIPALLMLAARFGVVGGFAARPAADVMAFFVTVAYLWTVHAKYRGRQDGEAAAKPSRGLAVEADAGNAYTARGVE